MYKLLVTFILLISLVSSAIAQTNNQDAGNRLANHIADKLKDSLSLSSIQRDQLFAVNIDLHNKKVIARNESQNRDSIGMRLQQIENKRDSLYRTILSEQQYLIYTQKKQFLISAQ